MREGDLICFTLAAISLPDYRTSHREDIKLYGIVIKIDSFTATVLHAGRTHFWPVGNCEKV